MRKPTLWLAAGLLAAGLACSAAGSAVAAPARPAEHVPFVDTGRGQVSSVDVTPCDTDPCTLTSGDTTEIRFTFVAQDDASQPTANLRYYVDGMWVDLPGSEEIDLCADQSGCAITAGWTTTVQLRITPPSDLPDLTTRLGVLVSDPDAGGIASFTIPISIASAD